jgi:hypothetical protein
MTLEQQPPQQFNLSGEKRDTSRLKNLTEKGGDDDTSSISGDLEIQKKTDDLIS